MVNKGHYFCIYAIKISDYAKTKLEYWAWNVPIYKDLAIYPKYQRMEVYGINAFEPQVGPFNTYRIYFRPMSLTEGLKLDKKAIKKGDTIDIAPKVITADELEVKINGAKAEIVSIDKVLEYARGTYMIGYDLQVIKPEEKENMLSEDERVEGHDKITIILNSKETGDIGMGEHFYRKIKYSD